MVMKVFHVWVDEYKHGEYTDFVVIDESVESVLSKVIVDDYGCREYVDHRGISVWFSKSQGEIHVEEIDLTTNRIVCKCFNS